MIILKIKINNIEGTRLKKISQHFAEFLYENKHTSVLESIIACKKIQVPISALFDISELILCKLV